MDALATEVGPELRRWEAEQVVRMHSEPRVTRWKDPINSHVELVPTGVTGRCAQCADDGCGLYEQARALLVALTLRQVV